MSFISFEFFAFIFLLLIIYFLMPGKWQWITIPIFSMAFYLSYGIESVGFILFTIILTYIMGILLKQTDEWFSEKRKQCEDKQLKKQYKEDCARTKKKIMLLGLMVNFGIWAVLKYVSILKFMPLGISIYTFIAAGYCIDVYRGKFAAEKNFLKYCSFVTFFPHIVQGPFSRYDMLGTTLFEKHSFDYERFGQGALRMAWGYFKKLVVANRITIVVDIIMAGDSQYGGIYVFLLFILLPIRLYADFSGYMDIVAGLCHILGIRLQENFIQPFFAKSIDEFWRRWHITLGAWFRDYLFYPVSMSKSVQKVSKKLKTKVSPSTARLIPSYIALVFVWTATGLWHGRTPNYILWGWINLFCIVTGMQFKSFYTKIKQFLHISDENRIWQGFQMVRTFLIFGFAEMVSDTRSMYGIFMNCKSLISEFNWQLIFNPLALFPGLSVQDLVILAGSVLVIVVLDVLKEKKIDIYELVHRIPVVVRYVGYVVLFYGIILLGYFGADVAEGFMYAQF